MSAHLTVYSMAIEAERPLRLRAADQARLAAQAEAALGRGSDPLLRRLGSALRQFLVEWSHRRSLDEQRTRRIPR